MEKNKDMLNQFESNKEFLMKIYRDDNGTWY